MKENKKLTTSKKMVVDERKHFSCVRTSKVRNRCGCWLKKMLFCVVRNVNLWLFFWFKSEFSENLWTEFLSWSFSNCWCSDHNHHVCSARPGSPGSVVSLAPLPCSPLCVSFSWSVLHLCPPTVKGSSGVPCDYQIVAPLKVCSG